MSDINGLNLSQLNLTPNLDMIQSVSRQIEENQRNTFRAVEAARLERERNEQEKRDSLRRIAENSEDTVNSLKETNELLRENNTLLKHENEML